MPERWKQVRRAGEVGLYPFTRAELDAVTLDAEALPEAERGPFLQAVTPLLAAPGGADVAGQAAPGPAPPGWAAPVDRVTAASAEAVTRLERLGFLRLGRPALTAGQVPAARAAPAELAGWAAVGGEPGGRRPVTLLGDLAIVTRIRAQPVWVAEVSVAPEPARPGPTGEGWPVAARIYAPHHPPVRLVEQPAGAQAGLPPYVLVRDDRAVRALVGWCGADVAAALDARPVDAARPEAGPAVPMPTAEISGVFAAVTLLRVAVAQGPGVLLRTLVVATGERRHWLLEGDQWQLAAPVSPAVLESRVTALLTPPADG